MPCPPPMQADPIAYWAFLRLNKKILHTLFGFCHLSSWARWAVMRLPLAARGCPKAIAPPFTFNRSKSSLSSRWTANTWGANASFTCFIHTLIKWTKEATSIKSTLSKGTPVFLHRRRIASTGPIPMIVGSQPTDCQPSMRRSGVKWCFATLCSSATTTAAAPSHMPCKRKSCPSPNHKEHTDAFPEFTRPFFWKLIKFEKFKNLSLWRKAPIWQASQEWYPEDALKKNRILFELIVVNDIWHYVKNLPSISKTFSPFLSFSMIGSISALK